MPAPLITTPHTFPGPIRFECPYRILFGPLYRGSMPARWLGHPNIRTFNSDQVIYKGRPGPSPRLNADGYYDLGQAHFADILASLLARLPRGWEPDLVIWNHLAMMGIPPGIEDCPYPTLAVIDDWPLNFQPTLDYLDAFDYVVSDKALIRILARIGFERCAFWPCYAHDPMQYYLLPGLERPYDVVFPGHMGYAHHRARNPWLERLCRLGDRHKVLISDRYQGQDYLRLLNQSKIVFNFEQRKVLNMRTYEAAACGALVMCEADNLEIRDFLTDGESCVLYTEADMEEKIAYYLAHDDERQRIARNGLIAISRHDCEWQFARLLELVPAVQAAFKTSARQRFKTSPPLWKSLLRARHLSGCISPGAPERSLQLLSQEPVPQSPVQAAQLQAFSATLQINYSWDAGELLNPEPVPPAALQALSLLEAAVARLPADPWQAFNLACAYSMLHQPQRALPLWQRLIPRLAATPVDFQTLSWQLLLPRGHLHTRHELSQTFAILWDKSSAAVLAGLAPPETLNRLLLWQALEFSGYCLMWVQRPDDAIQAFLQAEAIGPGSYLTYAPLLQLLLQSGREQDLRACLQRAVAKLGLMESLQRDLIMTLLRQRRHAELSPILHFYRLLLQGFEGGSTQARGTMQAWIPAFLVWLPELISTQLEWAGIGNR